MKTAIKLILIYFAFQIGFGFLVSLVTVIYSMVTTGSIEGATGMALVPIMLLSMIAMVFYLWKAGYISTEKVTWSGVSPLYLVFTVILYAAALVLMDFLLSYVHLPDLMESSFENLESSWIGIFCIVLLGPVLEELMFRGAITKALLARYNPTKAIIISALIFGIFHLNPAQIVSATLIGLILGWVYYKTASLIPCILIHIMNNGLAVYLSAKYPDANTLRELVPEQQYLILLGTSVVVFGLIFYLMNKVTIPYPWKKDDLESEITETFN